jgi:hypothetical protein
MKYLLLLLLSKFSLLSCSWEIFTYSGIVILRSVRLDGLIFGLKISLQLNMCQELQIFAFVCMYVFGCKLSLFRLCDSDFGITAVDYIAIGIS